MVEIEFNYNNNKNIIQCNKNEKMKDIFNRFINKINIDGNNIYYIYSGNIINEELKYEEIVNVEDKNRNKMNILVIDRNDNNNIENKIIKSNEIICPICLENNKINIIDYKIYLECRNKHKINEIDFNELENNQKIDISKIKCEICNIYNKSNIYNNIFYRCNKCKKNICPICKYKHDNNHNIINYDNINYICNIHNKDYISYCKECNKNICMLCEREHNNHEIIYYGKIIPNIEEIKKKIKN